MTRLLVFTGLLFLAALPVAAQDVAPVDFHTKVVPILMSRCYECHGADQSKGGFSINTRSLILDAEAVEPGNSAKSLLIELVESADPQDQMPPKTKARLSKAEIDTLRQWIDQGMKWEEGFTFAKSTYEPPMKPRRPELPAAVKGRENPVDRIIDAYLKEHKVKTPPVIDDAAYYRRLSLDLVGLLPDPEDLERFVADKDPDKRSKLADQLLGDRVGYARHWLTFWNDLLRNDYKGTGYIDGGRKSISNWLYQSLLENKPYNQFTRELLAPPTGLSEGFINGIQWRGNVNASQTREVQFAQNVGQVFLGMNLKCASCHDSFIDRWTLDEAYSLAAVYAQEPVEINRCDKPTGKFAKPAWLFPELGQIDAEAPQKERLTQLADLMTSPENGRLTRTMVNRLWHLLMGRGIVYPVDAMQTEPWSADLLDLLAVELSDNGYDLKSTMRLIVTSQAYQSQAISAPKEPEPDAKFVYTGPMVKRMTAEQFVDAIRQVTQTPSTKASLPASQLEQAVGAVSTEPGSRAGMFTSDLLQRALGRPNREQVVTSRPQQLTTLQALDLANGQALNDLIKAGASQLIELHGKQGPDAMIDLVYRRALSRKPSNKERAVCRAIVGESLSDEGVQDLLWSIFMLPEFQHAR